MPVDRPWAELLVNADDELVPYLAVMSSIESLHRMTREERDLAGIVIAGSDHLTAYNLYAEAYSRCGYVGQVYGLPRHLFDERIEQWAEKRGVLIKAIEDTALGMASVFRALGMPLPDKMTIARDHIQRKFSELLARFMPFDLVIDEETADGTQARVSRTSVCGSWGAIAGEIRYFADRSGIPRAAVEGTQIPMHLIRRYATRGVSEIVYDPKRKGGQLLLTRTLDYFGFELERETEPIEVFPDEIAARARHALADALARGEARHPAVKRNRAAIEEIRSTWRRSGGTTPRFGLAELTAWYERQLASVRSMDEFRNARLTLDPDEIVPREVRAKYATLPSSVEIRDREIDIDYDVEERDGQRLGVARLRLPEKLARNISASELPVARPSASVRRHSWPARSDQGRFARGASGDSRAAVVARRGGGRRRWRRGAFARGRTCPKSRGNAATRFRQTPDSRRPSGDGRRPTRGGRRPAGGGRGKGPRGKFRGR